MCGHDPILLSREMHEMPNPTRFLVAGQMSGFEIDSERGFVLVFEDGAAGVLMIWIRAPRWPAWRCLFSTSRVATVPETRRNLCPRPSALFLGRPNILPCPRPDRKGASPLRLFLFVSSLDCSRVHKNWRIFDTVALQISRRGQGPSP
jgi:hypothetical protein